MFHYCERPDCGKPFTRNPGPGRPAKYCDEHKEKPRAPKLEKPELPDPIPAPKRFPGKHKEFATLVAVAEARVPALLVGPAGTGKTTAAQQLAEYLGLSCREKSCHILMTDIDLLGYMTATGVYVPGIVRHAFEFGGVVLLDEIDASNPAVLVALNGIAATEVGQYFTFPDGKSIPRHQDFVLVAGANTFGDGASDEYVGREQLDAATLDRFACIVWETDETLEKEAAKARNAAEWCAYVQRVRRVAKKENVRLLVTPRATYNGARLLAQGMHRAKVEELLIWRGIDADSRRTMLSALAGR